MAEYDDGPTVIQVDYISPFAPHSHRLHAREWNPVSLTGTMGSFTDWLGAQRDAEDMLVDLIGTFLPLHRPGSMYTLATILTKPTIDAPLIPVASKSLSLAGTNALTTHSKAIQSTMSMRTTLFHPAKLVFLDVPHNEGEFDKEFLTTMGVSYLAVFDEFAAAGNAWCGKDGAQPETMVSLTWNINQALRKQYGMA